MSWKQRYNAKKSEISDEPKKESKIIAFNSKKYEKMNIFNEILDGFALYGKKFPQLFMVFGLLGVIIAIITVLIFTNLEWQLIYVNYYNRIEELTLIYGPLVQENLENWPLELQAELINAYYTALIMLFFRNTFKFLAFTISWMICAKYLSENIKNKEYSLKDSINDTFKKANARNIIFYLTFVNLLFNFGISFLIIPGMLFLMLIGFSFHVLSNSKFGFRDLLRIGYSYGNGYRGRTFFLMIIGVSFYLFFQQLVVNSMVLLHTGVYTNDISLYREVWLNPQSLDFFSILYAEIIELTSTSLFQPLIICFIAVQFVEIGVVKKVDLNMNMKDLENSLSGEENHSSSKTDAGPPIPDRPKGKKGKNYARIIKAKGGTLKYYCPKCGQRVKPKSNNISVNCENCKFLVQIPNK